MGYDTSRLNMVTQGITGIRQWHYVDTGGEASSVYVGAGYFTDAGDRGADTGDYILIWDSTNTIQYSGYFSAVQDTGAPQGTVVLDTG